ncbi:FAD-linked oxidoreductase [Sanghuangporus baumii]|uniref:Proline dehydrogenase n=1 Tax=Sanghuangporus baumii TaxID=108892 RepID=A0A9Q5I3B6_SANBA|nr:FAD-linked oxidoreductase [Sanghuangporus baumii]
MLVDYSPTILSTLLSIPGISYLTDTFVRATFFSQFVGGETAVETLPVLNKLRTENKGTLLAYSVEVDEDEASGKAKIRGPETGEAQPVHKHIVDEMIRCIDVAADFEDRLRGKRNHGANSPGRKTWVAVKLSALLPDAQALINFSKHLVNTRPRPARLVCFPGSPRPSDFDVLNVDPISLPEKSPLEKQDLEDLRELRKDLFRICQRAKERGVKIIIDAEYSWYQPAIDAYQRALMAEFNRLPQPVPQSIFTRTLWKGFRTSGSPEQDYPPVQPLIYGTFQAYLRRWQYSPRTPEHLVQSLLDAEAGNYALGVKLVRGAYHPFEVSAHATRMLANSETKAVSTGDNAPSSPSISPEPLSPVWENKAETDEVYDTCARMLIKHVAQEIAHMHEKQKRGGSTNQPIVPRIGVLFGTHNLKSCEHILDAFVREGLATRSYEGGLEVIRITDDAAERIALGQLYGTRDALTDYLVEKTRSSEPFVIKYVPYGKLSEVMPYLGRRAIENKSVLGNGVAKEERRQAGSEIIRRICSFFT